MAEAHSPRRITFRPKDVGVEAQLGATVKLNLRDEAGNEIFVLLDEGVARVLGFEMVIADAKAHATSDNPQPDIPFDTEIMASMSMMGNGSGGHVILRFLTPADVWLTTSFGPALAAQLANDLTSSLMRMAIPPENWERPMMVSPLKGKTRSSNTITYFGQDYPRDIVEVLGIIIIRANLLESQLISLLTLVSDMDVKRSEIAFFSARTNQARLDLIRHMTPESRLTDEEKSTVITHLGKVKAIATQRNALVHGEWSFKADKFAVSERSATQKTKSQDTIVSHKSLTELATRYHDEAVSISLTVSRAMDRLSNLRID